MSKIELSPATEKVIKIAEGNPGAIFFLKLIKDSLDEESFIVLCEQLEEKNITGSKIWDLF